ncbi:MAG: nitrite/sulfite reductase [Fibrobacteres bacterium]|nr:nitrite/sulfite reductase [Fibrobacterota bacterium]
MKELENHILEYRSGLIARDSFKHHHVKWGVYEQRKDGLYMVRSRMPGGKITVNQLREVANLAKIYGSGRLHISTRQEFQLHEIPLANLLTVIAKLNSIGLSSFAGGGNTVRNIVVSEWSGIKIGVPELSIFAESLTKLFLDDEDSIKLPRKFKIGFFYHDEVDNGRFQDLGFVLNEGGDSFKVYAGGGFGRNPSSGILLEEKISFNQVYETAKSVRTLFYKHGNRENRNEARLRYVLFKHGEERFRALYNEILANVKKSENPKLDYSLKFNNSNNVSILIPIICGDISSGRVLELAGLLDGLGDDVVRLTQDQNIRLRDIPTKYQEELTGKISNLFAPVLKYAVSCSGVETCRLGITDSRNLLRIINSVLSEKHLNSDIKIRISGCSNSCGNHLNADIGLAGKKGRYAVYVRSQPDSGLVPIGQLLGEIKEEDVPEFIKQSIEIFEEIKNKRNEWKSHIEALLKRFHGE